MPATTLITAPTDRPVSLAEAYEHLRVGTSPTDASLIATMLDAAISHIDAKRGWLGIALCPQTWELVLDDFPDCDGEIKLPFPPLIQVVSIKYRDASLTEQTLDPASYMVDTDREPGWVVPGEDGWPEVGETINAVRVRFSCGWAMDGGSPEAWTGPASIRAAIRLMLSDLYENRQGQTAGVDIKVNPTVDALLMPHRIWAF